MQETKEYKYDLIDGKVVRYEVTTPLASKITLVMSWIILSVVVLFALYIITPIFFWTVIITISIALSGLLGELK